MMICIGLSGPHSKFALDKMEFCPLSATFAPD